MVVRGEVGGQDLRQVAPLGQEDDEECGHRDSAVRGHLPLHDLLVLALLGRLAHRQRRTEEEHARHDGVEHLVGQEVEQGDADGDGDDDVHHEGGGGAEPHEGRATPSRHDQGREHRLVRELADEDDREDGEDDGEMHEDLSVGAERSVRGCSNDGARGAQRSDDGTGREGTGPSW